MANAPVASIVGSERLNTGVFIGSVEREKEAKRALAAPPENVVRFVPEASEEDVIAFLAVNVIDHEAEFLRFLKGAAHDEAFF